MAEQLEVNDRCNFAAENLVGAEPRNSGESKYNGQIFPVGREVTQERTTVRSIHGSCPKVRTQQKLVKTKRKCSSLVSLKERPLLNCYSIPDSFEGIL